MPDEFRIFHFTFDGRATSSVYPQTTVASPPLPDEDKDAVESLNNNAEQVAQDLEREINRLLRLPITVQAEVRFYKAGSIDVLGTISFIIIPWLATRVWAAVESVLEQGFTQVLEVAVRRVLQPFMRLHAPHTAPMRDIRVTPQPVRDMTVTPQPTRAQTRPLLDRLRVPDTSINMFIVLITILLFIMLISQIVLITLIATRWQSLSGV
jgi:hypothetical protein